MNKCTRSSIVIIPFLLLASTPAVLASSHQAWRDHFREAEQKCLKASEFVKPEPVGRFLLFDDSVGYDVLRIQGKYPQPHMKNATGQGICLFNKKTRKAYFTAE